MAMRQAGAGQAPAMAEIVGAKDPIRRARENHTLTGDHAGDVPLLQAQHLCMPVVILAF